MGKDYQSVILKELISSKHSDNFKTYSRHLYKASEAAVASALYGGIQGEKYGCVKHCPRLPARKAPAISTRQQSG